MIVVSAAITISVAETHIDRPRRVAPLSLTLPRKGGGNPSVSASLTGEAESVKTAEKISLVAASIRATKLLPNDRRAVPPLLFSLRYRRLSPKSPFSLCARPFRARKEEVSCDRSSHCSATRPPGSAAALRRSSRSLPPACRRPARSFPPAAKRRIRAREINSLPFRVSANVVPPGSAGAAGRVPCHVSSFSS